MKIQLLLTKNQEHKKAIRKGNRIRKKKKRGSTSMLSKMHQFAAACGSCGG